jgi:hypothetical protein
VATAVIQGQAIELPNRPGRFSLAGLEASYAAGLDVVPPVAIRWRGRWLAVSGAHRLTALQNAVDSGALSERQAARRVVWLKGAELTRRGAPAVALDGLARCCEVEGRWEPGHWNTSDVVLALWEFLPERAAEALNDDV